MKADIYTVGGTVDSQQRAYVVRQADDELLQRCLHGEFVYILTSRQMGKSSLMVRTARRLRERGHQSAILDLSKIGTDSVTEEQWYLGLLEELGEQLDLDTDPLDFWDKYGHLGYAYRFARFVEHDLLRSTTGRITIFIDEIDATLSLQFSTADFFAVIRQLYNARAANADLYRLNVVLIGVATPNDLIADPNRTPFNIGSPINLGDFALPEVAPLKQAFSPAWADEAMKRVFYWTDGHPYLTQRLCNALVDEADTTSSASVNSRVDACVEQIFFDERAAQDSNLDFVKNMLTRRLPKEVTIQDLLSVYSRILRKPEPDDAQSVLKNHLKLSGVVKRQGEQLVIRNRLYRRAFSAAWARANLPSAEWRRELIRRAWPAVAIIGVVMAVILGVLARSAHQARKEAERARIQAQSSFLSAGALLAAYAPGAYNGRADRAGLLARQALRVQETFDNISNLLRTLQGIGHSKLILQGHSEVVLSVAFSPDGTRVVSGSEDGTVRLWEASSGKPLGEPWQGHSDWVWSVAFSPDGTRVVSGSEDGTIRLWEASSGKPLGEPWQGHSDAVLSVAFSPDGKWVLSGGADNPNSRWDYMILLWNVDKSDWLQSVCRIAGRNFSWSEWQRYMDDHPYGLTCDEFPVHPTVIRAWLDKAAELFSNHKNHKAEEHYQQAQAWAQDEKTVKYDMIALFLDTLQSLDMSHPLAPRLRGQIDAWVQRQPETNRTYWQERLAAFEAKSSPASPR